MTHTPDLTRALPVCMTVAGSDSGGGAGIQADLRTFTALGVFGTSAVTAVTAQNPYEVAYVQGLSPETVAAQIRTVCQAMMPSAVKSGMLFSAEIIEAAAAELESLNVPYILDPVMISTSGRALLQEEAIAVLKEKLLKLASWITPNIPEAQVLCDRKIENMDQAVQCAQMCAERWNTNVLLKGGHAQGEYAGDIAVCEGKIYLLEAPRVSIRSNADHGTGCTLSAALCACLAKGLSPLEALTEAKAFVLGSLTETVLLSEEEVPAMYIPQCGSSPYRKLIRCQEL